MNKTLIGAFTLMASLGLATSAQAAAMSFTSSLSGDQIVALDGTPDPKISLGTGVATLRLNKDMTKLSYTLTLNGLGLTSDGGTVRSIHLHTGFANQRTPFHVLNIFGPADDADAKFSNLSATSVTVKGIWDDSDFCKTPVMPGMGGVQTCEENNDTTKELSAYLTNLTAGGLYWNIHTETVRSGEIRGQVNPVNDNTPVPEPLTILGAGTAISFGAAFKRKLAKKK
ncbi:PEP-CTERM sorting domain-containing protein [Aphanothece sacrum]|uniref:CHRD domain-containing protein n=1 Tax=Aphanothece sacrum FPU1 TaxID=1920663 RepID=A0A401IHQ3_APHSA|nr:PEP-CTERM sorting domain-containing protein [Aphanothece sacrum]GBF80730.1 CHRD domain-containing protein [Aphanothece sacrum FPU1]GBF83224.1 hypothetical protein AsFPU3_0264 [Aphanothece sacrum FPU3]